MKFLNKVSVIAIAAMAVTQAPAWAQDAIDDAERDAAVTALAQVIEDEFFDAERAAIIASGMRTAEDDGAFDEATTAQDLAEALTAHLHEQDRHFSVRYIGPEAAAAQLARRTSEDSAARDAANAEQVAQMARRNFAFDAVEILPGNIGYIELRGFAPIDPAEPTARAALEFVAHTDAVIFDLRKNRGGDPTMVQYLTSHFLEPGGETLINTFVSRDYEYPNQMWSLPSHPAGNRPDVPVYVLTSGNTASAGEAFSYHLQAMERGTLVGETTYGAGNPGGVQIVPEGYGVFVSTGSARNPITGTNWEGTGVTPDIEIDADQALDRALMEAYGALERLTEDEGRLRELGWMREALEVAQNPVVLSADELAVYAGDFGPRDIRVEAGGLIYQREGRDPVPLIALGAHRFKFANEDDYRLVFQLDRRGRVEALEVRLLDGRTELNPVVR
ncbi:S41 family peptidase [Maricaulis salignorans]|uniref:S41 family peptidase n=1 Tax=Maricaulis salignorans TaxID=144026 RepID=UPI003A8DCE81